VDGGAVVGHAQGELVEAVEQQRDLARAEHVAEGGQVDPVLAVRREVLRDQLVHGARLLQRPQLDEHGRQVGQRLRDAPGQLAQQERLAAAEVAEEEGRTAPGRTRGRRSTASGRLSVTGPSSRSSAR